MKNTKFLRQGLLLAGLLAYSAAGFAAPEATDDVEEMKSLERARTEKAVKEAASDAIESLKANNKLDLDIRLIGPNSITIAGRK